jgi:hypothetical protein
MNCHLDMGGGKSGFIPEGDIFYYSFFCLPGQGLTGAWCGGWDFQ